MLYIASYIIIWCLLFFISLPIAIEEKEISDKNIYKKEITNINVLAKVIIVTLLSIPATYGFVYYFNKFIVNQILYIQS